MEDELAVGTLKSYLQTLADLHSFLKSRDKGWKDLKKKDVVEYIHYLKDHGSFSNKTSSTRPNSTISLRNKACNITAFLSWIESWCKREEIPYIIKPAEIEAIKKIIKKKSVIPDLAESKRRGLMEEDVEHIRSMITDPVVRNIFDLGLNLGLRVSEFEKVTMEMILGKPEERAPIPRYESEHYIEILGKGNIIREVVVTEEMNVLIKKQLFLRKLHRVEHNGFFFSVGKLKSGKLRIDVVNRIYKKLSEATGIYFRQHDLRYTMAVLFQRKGIEQNLVAQRLGHKGGITQRYSRAKIIDRYKLFQKKIGTI